MSKIRSNKLSFEMEEGDEEEAFVVKKGAAANSETADNNKKFKKMKQAPIAPIEEPIQRAEFGSSYSLESLRQLRENQNFASKIREFTPIEGEEFSGEAAEKYTEKLNNSKKVMFSMPEEESFDSKPKSNDELSDTADYIAFSAGKLSSGHLLRGKSNTKMSTTFTDKKEVFDMEVDNDEEWESEMARRGNLQNNTKAPPTVLSKSYVIGENTEKEDITVNSSKSKYSFGGMKNDESSKKYLTMEECAGMMRLAIDKITIQSESTDRQITLLQTELVDLDKEIASHKAQLEIEKPKHVIMQNVEECFTDLIEMLREKMPMIEELKNTVYNTARDYQSILKRHRIEEQEDFIHRIKEASELMTVGEYIPSAILDSTQSIELLPTLKKREAANRLNRLRVVNQYKASSDVNLSPEECQLFVAGRIDKITSIATQKQLYNLDLVATTFYDATIDQQQRLDTLQSAADAVMSDVEPLVYDVSEIVKQLTAFRDTFPDRYKSAYISPSLPEVLEPLIWFDVLSSTGRVFPSIDGVINSQPYVISDRPWHEPLREFSAMSVGDESAAKVRTTITNLVNEGDTNLLPKVVAAVFLPWLTEFIKFSLDPLSSKACSVCSDLISQVLDYDVSDTQLAPLLEVLLSVFDAAISNLCIPVVKHPQVDSEAAEEGSSSGIGRAFVIRQLNRLLTILRNLQLFSDFLSPVLLMKLGWTVISVKCLAPVVKLLSASDFKNADVVFELCFVCCSLIEGDSKALDLTATLKSGLKIPLFRELRATIEQLKHEVKVDIIRTALYSTLSKF